MSSSYTDDEVLEVWYICDGHIFDSDGSFPRPRISALNEASNWGKIKLMFNQIGLSPSFSDKEVLFDVEDAELFWDIVGEHPPGFGYKWPDSKTK
jgi:hypothetical protein